MVQKMCIKETFLSESNIQKWELVFSKFEIDEDVWEFYVFSFIIDIQRRKISLFPVYKPKKRKKQKKLNTNTSTKYF